MSFKKRFLSTTLVTLMVVTAFLIGAQLNTRYSAPPVWAALTPTALDTTLDDTVSLRPVQLFQQAFTAVQQEYVDPISQPEELTYAAIRGMLLHMKDPYTRFMDPKEFKEFNEKNEGRIVGIGATLNMSEFVPGSLKAEESDDSPTICPICKTNLSEFKLYRVTVVKPMDGSPAQKAGLQPGDFIVKVGDIDTEGLLLDEVVEKIRGPEGTEVTLTLSRKGVEKPIEVTITRAPIEVPATESKMLDGKIGYLRLYLFNEKTVEETRTALHAFNADNARGLVLDLRGNPGGLMQECERVASMFLPATNRVILYTKGRDRKRVDEVRKGVQIFDKPVVVLTDKGSASASEILTGALKDYQRATIVGETTFGKALVQTVIPLGDAAHRCAMPVTTARYYTPSGYDLNKKGIAPDVTVELDKETKEISAEDNQATAALKILREEIANGK